jgi:hypothetical protein
MTDPDQERPPTQLMDLGDDALSAILEHVTRSGGAGDLARTSCASRRIRRLAYEQMRTVQVLDMRPLGRKARLAAPHLSRICESLTTIVCDGTNVTDENVTVLLAASQGTLVRLSLADCRHLRDLHRHVFQPREQRTRPTRLAELNLRGSSWAPAALAALLRDARRTLTSLNLSSTCVSHSSLKSGEDFGEVARCILECRGLRRLHLGAPVDFVPACLVRNIFSMCSGLGGGGVRRDGDGDSDGGGGERFSALEELSLSRNGAAVDATLADIARLCPALRQLDIRGSAVSATGVVAFVSSARCALQLRSLLLVSQLDTFFHKLTSNSFRP